MERKDNQHFAVELCKLVSRGGGRQSYGAKVIVYQDVDNKYWHKLGLRKEVRTTSQFSGGTLEELASTLVKEGVKILPQEEIKSISGACLSFLQNDYVKCPVNPYELIVFESHYKKAIAHSKTCTSCTVL
ncbi:hypothetical protein GOV03_04325 [Candidatus Woesearchaeota archaeon]|nr:hypothetical protein [Candidatus Woesearchaeota archaeon]